MPKISVIVPNYNHARFLKQRLDSVFKQTFQDFEVILLDDCSTDNSVEILKEYAKNPKVSHFVVNKKNSGSTFKQWKKGIDLAEGEYIWIAESDDWADERFLETLILFMKNNEFPAVCFCKSYNCDETNKIKGIFEFGEKIHPEKWCNNFIEDGDIFISNYLINRNVLPNSSSVIFKKSIAVSIIERITKFKYAGDWLFWAYIISSEKIAFYSEPLNYFRRYKNAASLKLNDKIIYNQAKEFIEVIKIINKELLNKTKKKTDHDWIINFWLWNLIPFISKKFFRPPFYFGLRLKFYKKVIQKKIIQNYLNSKIKHLITYNFIKR